MATKTSLGVFGALGTNEAAAHLCSALELLEGLMDATFTFADFPGETVRAHKLVLAAWSPVFRAMFYGDLKEEDKVELVDIEPTVFKMLIDFMYNRSLAFASITQAIALYVIADKYDVPKLGDKVEQYLVANITAFNSCEVYEQISLYDFPKAKAKCYEKFELTTKQVLDSPGFLKVSAFTVNTIFTSGCLDITSELELCQALERWLAERKAEDGQDYTLKLKEAIGAIRFLKMDIQDICKVKLLSSETRLAVIFNKLSPDSEDLPYPPELSKNTEGRNILKYEKAIETNFSFQFGSPRLHPVSTVTLMSTPKTVFSFAKS